MIRTLVVDDDYRVAHIHSEGLARVPGFESVGEAHTAAEARAAIRALSPDLLLLDLYLPDESGLSLLRSLRSESGGPDCIVITASRDIETVRTAMRGGAFYYLVKPFGLEQLARELESYREWRSQAAGDGTADQQTIDELFRPSRAVGRARPLTSTMRRVLDVVRAAEAPIGASAVAARLGISRPTAQRYLSELEQRGYLELNLFYGSTGRPTNTYRARR